MCSHSQVERQLTGSGPWTVDDDDGLVIHHCPGHSMGSLLLHFRPESCLFTGDSLAYSAGAGRLTMFPWYGYDTALQARHVWALLGMEDFLHVLPGHGRPWVFSGEEEKRRMFEEMMEAEGHALPS